jgi:hypothetical protein
LDASCVVAAAALPILQLTAATPTWRLIVVLCHLCVVATECCKKKPRGEKRERTEMKKEDRNLRRRPHPPHATGTARHLYRPKGEGGDLGGGKKFWPEAGATGKEHMRLDV